MAFISFLNDGKFKSSQNVGFVPIKAKLEVIMQRITELENNADDIHHLLTFYDALYKNNSDLLNVAYMTPPETQKLNYVLFKKS